jgi:hypothetical protein
MGRIYVDEILPGTGTDLFINGSKFYTNFIGEIKQFRTRRATSKDFPFWDLSLPDQTIPFINYPDYTDYLRNIKVEAFNSTLIGASVSSSSVTITTPSITLLTGTLIYFHTLGQFRIIISNNTLSTTHTIDEPLTASAQSCSIIDQSTYVSSFSGSWSGTAFTLTDNPQNRILLDALSEDAYYQGANFNANLITPINPSNWITLRWGTTDINISSFNPTTRVINITSGVPTGTTIELYPNRILNSSDARHRQIEDSTLINNGIQVISGLRLRDRMQGHRHQVSGTSANVIKNDPYTGAGTALVGSAGVIVLDPSTDATNGTPRTGQFTRPRGLGVIFYEFVGRVI